MSAKTGEPEPAKKAGALSDKDVDYLFRITSDDLGSTERRLRSLSAHFGYGTRESDQVEIAVSNVIAARSRLHVVARERPRSEGFNW